MTDAVTVSAPQLTRLVRIEAFAADRAFAKAFKAAVGAAVPAVGKVTDAPAGPVIWAEPKVVLASGDAAALAGRGGTGVFAPFVYRLGRHPFTVERAVRFR